MSGMESSAARLTSLDVLRGMDMLLIMGVDALVYSLYPIYSDNEIYRLVKEQMVHAQWAGLHLYDCIFPLFVYISGMSMCFSQLRKMNNETCRVLMQLWLRAAILVILGFFINGPLTWDLSSMRFASVLGLIGISGAVAGTFSWLSGCRIVPNLVLSAVILCTVALCQEFGGDYTPTGCMNARIDTLLCPGVLHNGSYDPEGPLCIVSAVALSLIGYTTGLVFLNIPSHFKRIVIVLLSGALLLTAGCFLPCIKGIWTPGFVLSCAGIGAILVAVLHLLIDVAGLHKISLPFRVIGMNALAIYMLTHIINFQGISARLLWGTMSLMLPQAWVHVANAVTALLLAWWFCYFLYSKRVFIKL